MYTSAFGLGFHGCDREVGERVLRGEEDLKPSRNEHDWLGRGTYFWENDPERALAWAEYVKEHPRFFKQRVTQPVVVGAIIDLGRCLDLTDVASLRIVRSAFEEFSKAMRILGAPMPENEAGSADDLDLVKRKLDCAVINYLHELRRAQGLPSYNTVRGPFLEGEPLFDGAKLRARTHVQIAVLDCSSIRGYFRPRQALD